MRADELERLTEDDDGIAGSYYMHCLIIELPAKTPLIDRTGQELVANTPRDSVATFFHEYLHFVHNFSTVSGFYSLETWHTVIGIVSKCVDEKGEIDATKLLPEEQAKIEEMFRHHDRLFGDVRVRTFTKASVHKVPPLDDDHDHPVVVEFDFGHAAGESTRHAVAIGLGIVLEGVAHECEALLRARLGLAPKSVPTTPYLCSRLLAEHILGPSKGPLGLSCGIVALQCIDPGRGLIQALRRARQLGDEGFDENAIVQTIAAEFLRAEVLDVVKSDLQSIRDQYEERGTAGVGARQFAELLLRLLDKRLADPVFELRELLQESGTITLLRDVEPCAVLQHHPEYADEEPPDSRSAVISAFGPPVSEIEEAAPRAFQSLIHYILSHLDGSSIVSSGDAPPSKCPFYEACDLPRRASDPQSCEATPWLSMRDPKSCWYGSAVVAMRGRVSLRVVPATDES